MCQNGILLAGGTLQNYSPLSVKVDTHTHRELAWELPGATCTWTPELPQVLRPLLIYSSLTHTQRQSGALAGQVYGSQLGGSNSSPDPTPAKHHPPPIRPNLLQICTSPMDSQDCHLSKWIILGLCHHSVTLYPKKCVFCWVHFKERGPLHCQGCLVRLWRRETAVILVYVFLFVSSDRSSYSDDGLLYIY